MSVVERGYRPGVGSVLVIADVECPRSACASVLVLRMRSDPDAATVEA
jgi:hypothetical protein